ncbi:MAG: alpha/beta hydrolase [Actinomycetota bacterium]|nr:alpha/beta hydrolase [Actinomycetota bacterium]
MFRLEGGPGLTNLTFPVADRFAATRDVVLVGYRGVDGSVRLDCPEVAAALKRGGPYLGEQSVNAHADALSSCATRLQDSGIDLDGYTLSQRVDDFDAARQGLGYEKIDLLSQSANSRTAMIYSWRYPERVHRSVMIGANPPGHYVWDPQDAVDHIDRYSQLCAEDPACSRRTDDLADLMTRTSADLPERWGFLPIKADQVRILSFFGLMESEHKPPLTGPMTIDAWLAAANGDASGFWFQSFGADMLFANPWVWGEYAALGRADAHAAARHFTSDAAAADPILRDAGTSFIWSAGGLIDAWPSNGSEDEYTRVQKSDVETLLVGGELDLATPPHVATKELLPHLSNGHQVIIENLGHTVSFWNYQPEASTRLITAFLDTGKVDDSLYRPATVDFTPELTQTAMGKGVGYSMMGLSVLMVLSLLGMRRRVGRRGAFGPVSAALLRSLYPMLLGLGGWFAAVLIVMTAQVTVALDDPLLAAASTGLPIGIGVYYTWVHRAFASGTKLGGFVAAVGGSLVGAWLGFSAVTGLLALFTATVGATAGAITAVIFLDIRRATHARRTAGETSSEAPSRPVSPAPAGSAV